MLSLILLLAPTLGNFQSISPTPTDIKAVSSYVQTIEAEDCQITRLRSFDIMQLEGNKLNKLIYLQTKSILKDSRAAGNKMQLNSTFRSCSEQTYLRSINCPASSLPAESCSPPTEKPGESLHNYGMAIDFGCDGYAIFSTSPCYTWLKDNANKYKFVQRDKEPWHWSLTGK